MNRLLLYVVENKFEYYGLLFNKYKCAIISTNGKYDVRFRDGIRIVYEDHISYLGGSSYDI